MTPPAPAPAAPAAPALDAVQALQEEEYAFPYHYLPDRTDGAVRQFQYWGWGYKYLAGIEFFLELLGTWSFERLVDVGCGDGRLLREIAARFPGRALVGIDYSERAIALARALNPGLDYRRHDLLEAPLGETFDVVTLSEVLEHIPPQRIPAFVDGMAALMGPGSKLLVTVPHANQKLNPKHYQHFTRASLAAALGPRLEVVEWHFFDRQSRQMGLWQRLLRNRFFVLNHAGLLDHVYRLYTRRYLKADENDCLRLAAVCRLR
jgi:SAM-dependent methyltransferase